MFINYSVASRRVSISLVFALILSTVLIACSSAEPEVVTVIETVIAEVPVTVIVTEQVTIEKIVEITREIEITRELEVTRIIERPVTVTPTSTPINSPTPSDTPTITPTPSDTPTPTLTSTPTATPDLAQTATIEAYGELASPKGDGFFTVGTEILPGKWRSTATSNGCYWARLDATQNLLGNHFGIAGGTVNIRITDFEVEFNDCGTWVYVEDEEKLLQDDATEPKENGFYTVGVEVASGIWQSTGTNDNCYWAKLDGNQNVTANHFGNAGGTVTIGSNDYEIEFNDCGTWEYQGP